MNDALIDLLDNPDWFLYHFEGDRAYFVPMSRQAFHDSIFCDSRIQTVSSKILPVKLDPLMHAFETQGRRGRPVSLLYHMAHVGSTLLSRGLDLPGVNVVYREPQALRQLGVWKATGDTQGAQGHSAAALLRLAMHMFSKPCGDGEKVIVKANVPVNFLISDLRKTVPDARAIVLYSGLEDYVLALHKSEEHRQWVGRIIGELAPGWAQLSGIEPAALGKLSLPQAIACIWLAQVGLFVEAVAATEHCRSLDSESLFSRPGEVLAAAFDHFGHPVSAPQLEAVVRGGVFSRHAKNPGVAYDNEVRRAEKRALASRFEREVEAARQWVETHRGRFPVPVAGSLTGALERSALQGPGPGGRGDVRP